MPTTSLDSLVVFNNSQSLPGRGTLLHLTRHSVALEVYNPYSIVQLSEVLHGVTILREGRPIYQGRAVVTALVPTGSLTIVSAALVDPWSDLYGVSEPKDITEEAERFIETWQQRWRLQPSYQISVNQLASFLQELDRWLGQAEALGSAETSVAAPSRQQLFERVWAPAERKLEELFYAFEQQAREISPEELPVHKAFAQRELHPWLLCDPFIHRSYIKPLGYAGDYQLVNMILGNSDAVSGTYARVINHFNLTRAPAAAHRNRIDVLHGMLRDETRRKLAKGERLRVLNIGCGPASEVERFVQESEAQACDLTLVDFNEETLKYAKARVIQAYKGRESELSLTMLHQSIHELLKAAASGRSHIAGQYDLVYCAGLFDYLSDRVCRRLVRLFYEWTNPGGLTVVTNVHAANPIRYYMATVAEWHLEYRTEKEFQSFADDKMPGRVFADPTGINIFLEIRKPEI